MSHNALDAVSRFTPYWWVGAILAALLLLNGSVTWITEKGHITRHVSYRRMATGALLLVVGIAAGFNMMAG